MRASVFSTQIAVLLLASGPALADPATLEDAAALRRTAAAYFGSALVDSGVIAITPKGESYLASIDLQKAIDAIKLPPGVRLTGHWSFALTPRAGGTWGVATDDFPTFTLDSDPDVKSPSFSMKGDGFHFSGVFDPKLASFISSEGSANSIDVESRLPGSPAGQLQAMALHQRGITISTKAAAAGEAGVTITFEEKIDHTQETISAPSVAKEGETATPAIPVTYQIGPLVADGSIEGLRAAALGDLWRLLVARADHTDPAPAEFPTALKERILSALPLWDRLAAKVTARDAMMQIASSKVTMKTFAENVSMSGLGAHGSLGFGLEVGGLSLETPMLAAWVASLMPTAFDFDMVLSADGLDKIVRLTIEDFQFGATPPLPAASSARMKAMLIAGDPKLTFARSHFASPNLDLTFEGELALTPPKPSGKMEVAADGLDKALAIIGKAAEDNPGLQKMMLGVTLLKELAKTNADGKLTWDVELGADGTVSVNGAPMPKSK